MIPLLRSILILLLSALCAPSWGGNSIAVLDRRELAIGRDAASPSHHLSLVLAYFDGAWTAEVIHASVRRSAQILAQCGVAIAKAELVRLDAPPRYRHFHTPVSRELARALPLRKPTIYFVADTRQQPAFEAEAIGRSNSGIRPELRDGLGGARRARP